VNYAWSNPSTGIREQTSHSTPERMLAEAKLRVWEELQELPEALANPTPETPFPAWQIYRQEPIGHFDLDGPTVDAEQAQSHPSELFAWTDPETGCRIVDELFPSPDSPILQTLKRQQASGQLVHPDAHVVIYATWPECTVSRSDPRPAEVPAEELPETGDRRAGDAPDIARFKEELETVIVLDDGVKLAKITAWALLDIAMTIREMSGDLRYPPEPVSIYDKPHYFIRGLDRLDDLCAICFRRVDHKVHKQLPPAPPRVSLWQRILRFRMGRPGSLRTGEPMTQFEQDVIENLREIRRHLQRPQEPGVSVIGPHPFKRSIRCDVCGQHQTNCIHTPPEAPLGHPVWTDGRGNFSAHETQTCFRKVDLETGSSARPPLDVATPRETARDLAAAGKPHMFYAGVSLKGGVCLLCFMPECHAIHGYTEDKRPTSGQYVDPSVPPHAFTVKEEHAYTTNVPLCSICQRPERHAIHGYTGE